MSTTVKLRPVCVSIARAEEFIATQHRFHPAPRGALFAVGVADDERLVAVGIVGRPVPPAVDDGVTAEVTRTGLDNTPGADVALYRIVWSLVRDQNYQRLITHIQTNEIRRGLQALGLHPVSPVPSRVASHIPRRARWDRGVDGTCRVRWEISTRRRIAPVQDHASQGSATQGDIRRSSRQSGELGTRSQERAA